MKILQEYTWDAVRRNKRSSVAIMIAVYLMTTMMSCLCGFFYTMWTDNIQMTKRESGDWHGELFDETYGKDLEHIENFQSVSEVMIKGPWQILKVSDEEKRPYLITRGADEKYWASMAEQYSVIEGRVPEKKGEIVLSKQYFSSHPEVKIGDTLTLPSGERRNGTEKIDENVARVDGETFRQTGTASYKVVGKLDVVSESVVPGYIGIHYLDRTTIRPEDQITVYLRFQNIRDTYRELPKIAEALGWEKDEYGEYNLRYNTDLLLKYGVMSDNQKSMLTEGSMGVFILMAGVMMLLVVALFVLVIHNAFALSANERISQLGILAGIGASPGQIRKSILFEGFLLSVIPIPVGIFSGWILDTVAMSLINEVNKTDRVMNPVILEFGLPAVLPALFLAFLTVWLSARIPAKKIAKMMPVEAIFVTADTLKVHRKRRRSVYEVLFGIEGELAANAIAARRRSYRTATSALVISFLLLFGFQYMVTVQEAAADFYGLDSDQFWHIQVWFQDGKFPDPAVTKQLNEVNGVEKSLYYNMLSCATWQEKERASGETESYMGGFEKISSSGKYSVFERNDKYRIAATVIGIDDETFREYCRENGIDPEPYFSDPGLAVFYNKTADPFHGTRKNPVLRDFLDLKLGEELLFTEKNTDQISGDHEFSLRVGAVAEEFPPIGVEHSKFTLIAVQPLSHVFAQAEQCCETRRNSGIRVKGYYLTEDTDGISDRTVSEAAEEIETIMEETYGLGDYDMTDTVTKKKQSEESRRVMNLIVGFLTGMLAVIGIANVWASITGNLWQRKREFAMLRSAGLSPKQLQRMLWLEGIFLGIRPLLISLPCQIVFLVCYLHLQEVSLTAYLPYAPYAILIGYPLLILLTVAGAYFVGEKKIRKQSIIDGIKDDTL
nr:FtsX-like permease family protein [uncultured Faecalimonas sp.]